jgi:hypothetical protein
MLPRCAASLAAATKVALLMSGNPQLFSGHGTSASLQSYKRRDYALELGCLAAGVTASIIVVVLTWSGM